ncbi:MAG: hypothetical protein ACR2H0_03715 [Candidatus Limnocylindrales bacterium]
MIQPEDVRTLEFDGLEIVAFRPDRWAIGAISPPLPTKQSRSTRNGARTSTSRRQQTNSFERSQLNSFISAPRDGWVSIGAGFEAPGYATPSGGCAIDSVEVRVDGAEWQTADLLDACEKDVWVRWRAQLHIEPGDHRITVRASDTSGATQPADMTERWNPKGYMNDTWHTIVVRIEAEHA